MYSLLLQVDGKTVCRVLYMDYRSGLTVGNNETDTEKRENTEFDYMLSNCAVLTFLIPGDALQTFLQMEDRDKITREALEIGRKVNRIHMLLERARLQGNTASPILFCVTKADLVDREERILPGLARLIEEYGLLPYGREVLGCYTTLGWDLDIRDASGKRVLCEQDGWGPCRIVAGFKPWGFPLPILLPVACQARDEARAGQDAGGRALARDLRVLLESEFSEKILYLDAEGIKRPISALFGC